MRIPQSPPEFNTLLKQATENKRFEKLVSQLSSIKLQNVYRHWDELRHREPPEGMNQHEWWLLTKITRMDSLRELHFQDSKGKPFKFMIPEQVQEALHEIDLGSGGIVSVPNPITNKQTRDKYIVSSLIEEAITSSQLEGAVTTREVAKEMLKSGRKPRDTSERMILNNFLTMKKIQEWKNEPLTTSLIFTIHKLVTEGTLDDPGAAGRLRNDDEFRVVGDDFGNVYHRPLPAKELSDRMNQMCEFANKKHPNFFIHPIVRAIILHFWLAYDHPFVDGNGRTARALFYWSMLNSGYWMFEFISISSIIRKAPAKYYRSFLYTETDDNDLSYFLVSQTKVIVRAIRELHEYIERKTRELEAVESQVRALDLFNHRQVDLIRHAMKHPGFRYTISSHKQSHGVTYQTARTDLLDLIQKEILSKRKIGRKMVFFAPEDLSDRLVKLEKKFL